MPPEDESPDAQAADPTDDAIIADLLANSPPPDDLDDHEPGPHDPLPGAAGDSDGGDDADDDEPADDNAVDDDDDATDDDESVADDEPEPGSLDEARAAIKAKDFKKLFELLGAKPEDLKLDPDAWTAWRAANARAGKRLKSEEKAAIERLSGWDANLKAQAAKLNQGAADLKAREERAAPIVQALDDYEKNGDPTALVRVVERATGKPYDEAQKDILHKTRRSPTERRMADQLEAMAAELAELKSGASKPPPVDPERVKAQDMQIIGQRIEAAVTAGSLDKAAPKIPHFAARVYNVLLKSRGPQGVTMTPEDAAAQVLRAERARITNHPFAKVRTKEAERPPTKKGKTPPLRRDSQARGARIRPADETNEDIIADLARKAKLERRAGGER